MNLNKINELTEELNKITLVDLMKAEGNLEELTERLIELELVIQSFVSILQVSKKKIYIFKNKYKKNAKR